VKFECLIHWFFIFIIVQDVTLCASLVVMVGVQCVLNGLSMMSDCEVVTALPQCVHDVDSVSKSTWEQLFKMVKLVGKSMNTAIATRGPVTLVLDRVKLCFYLVEFLTVIGH